MGLLRQCNQAQAMPQDGSQTSEALIKHHSGGGLEVPECGGAPECCSAHDAVAAATALLPSFPAVSAALECAAAISSVGRPALECAAVIGTVAKDGEAGRGRGRTARPVIAGCPEDDRRVRNRAAQERLRRKRRDEKEGLEQRVVTLESAVEALTSERDAALREAETLRREVEALRSALAGGGALGVPAPGGFSCCV